MILTELQSGLVVTQISSESSKKPRNLIRRGFNGSNRVTDNFRSKRSVVTGSQDPA